ncbi:hypothetical protein VNO77_02523 [Canavalia gladiata]|uniref:Uncharacterized protein n=1 Tax=Canavalia gladiata TaxID=3824 RepID=A0AAN9MV81_CANGL
MDWKNGRKRNDKIFNRKEGDFPRTSSGFGGLSWRVSRNFGRLLGAVFWGRVFFWLQGSPLKFLSILELLLASFFGSECVWRSQSLLQERVSFKASRLVFFPDPCRDLESQIRSLDLHAQRTLRVQDKDRAISVKSNSKVIRCSCTLNLRGAERDHHTLIGGIVNVNLSTVEAYSGLLVYTLVHACHVENEEPKGRKITHLLEKLSLV